MLCMCMCKIHIATIVVLGKSVLLPRTNVAVPSAPSVASPGAGHPGARPQQPCRDDLVVMAASGHGGAERTPVP